MACRLTSTIPTRASPSCSRQSAERHAGRVALRFMGRSVRYEELKRSVTAIALRACAASASSLPTAS